MSFDRVPFRMISGQRPSEWEPADSQSYANHYSGLPSAPGWDHGVPACCSKT